MRCYSPPKIQPGRNAWAARKVQHICRSIARMAKDGFDSRENELLNRRRLVIKGLSGLQSQKR